MDVHSTPTFFIGGRRHTGPYDAPTLIRELYESGQSLGLKHEKSASSGESV